LPGRRVWLTRNCSKRPETWQRAATTPIWAAAYSNSASLAKVGGKSGGFRTIILFRIGGRCFFAHGFAKSDKTNVSARELKALKKLADVLLRLSDEQLRTAKASGELIEVMNHDDDKQKG